MRFINNKVEKMATNPKLFAIADTLTKLTVLEAKQLIDILENDYGIKGIWTVQKNLQKPIKTYENLLIKINLTKTDIF